MVIKYYQKNRAAIKLTNLGVLCHRPVGFLTNTTRPTDIQTGLQKCEKSKVGNTCGVAKLDTFFHFQLCACLTRFLARSHPIVIEGGRTERKSKQSCSNLIIPIIYIIPILLSAEKLGQSVGGLGLNSSTVFDN